MNYQAFLSSHLTVDLCAKATLLLLVVAIVDRLFSRSAAALRHRLWATALLGLILLPIVSLAAPNFRLRILPQAWFEADTNGSNVDALLVANNSREVTEPSPTNATQHEQVQSPASEPAQWSDSQQNSPTGSTEFQSLNSQHVTPTNLGSLKSPLLSSSEIPAPSVLRWTAIIWLVGAVFAMLPLIRGTWKSVTLYRTSAPVSGGEMNVRLDELRRRLAISRAVELRAAEQPIVPMTWGVWRPIVLLPREALSHWDEERSRFVLLHELAHIKRLDVIYQTVARFACALYWFHPLAWYALRRLRVERELACDDCVVMTGERASDYAQQLLSIAKQYRSAVMPPAVAMAQRSGLEQRVRAILDRARSHLPISTTAAIGMMLAGLSLVTLLAMFRLDTKAQASHAGTGESVIAPFEEASVDESKKQLRIAGTVFDPNGKPVSGARVLVLRQYLAHFSWNHTSETLAELTTDASGHYSIDVPNQSARFSDGHNFESQTTRVLAYHPDFGIEELEVSLTASNKTDLRLPRSSVPISGQIVDLEGRPVANVKVSLQEIASPAAPVQEWLEQAKHNPPGLPEQSASTSALPKVGPKVALFPSRERIFAMNLVKPFETRTDEEGRFKLDGIGDDRKATLRIESPKIATALLQVVTRDMPAVNDTYWEPRFRAGKVFGNQFVHVAEPTQWISGTVTDRKTGSPVPGVKVSLSQFANEPLMISNFIVAETDSEGRYSLKGIPKAAEASRPIQLQILPSTDHPYFRSTVFVPKSETLEEIKFDVQLTRGIWIEGQVIDAKSKVGVPAMVAYYPARENPLADSHEAWDAEKTNYVSDEAFQTDSLGRFRIPGMTGNGALRVVASADYKYSYSELGLKQASERYYHIGRVGNAIVELNIGNDSAPHKVSITLEPRESKVVRVVDATGNSMTGYQVGGARLESGLSPSGRGSSYRNNDIYSSSDCEIFVGGEKNLERPLIFYHAARQLGAIIPLSEILAEKNDISKIVLKPCAKITGTVVVDKQKTPASGQLLGGIGLQKIHGMRGRPGGSYDMIESVSTKYGFKHTASVLADGKMEYQIPPGKGLAIILQQDDRTTALVEDFELAPGANLDLGTINLSQDRKDWPKPRLSQAKQESAIKLASTQTATKQSFEGPNPTEKKLHFKGIVKLPDGKPAHGAKIFFVHWDHERQPSSEVQPLAVTTESGVFEFDSPRNLAPEYTLVAALPGYGLAAQPSYRFETTGALRETLSSMAMSLVGKMFGEEAILKLVPDDQPLTGRVLNLEGQPVAGARIRLREIAWSNAGKLDDWHTATRIDRADFFSIRNQVPLMLNGYQLPSLVPDVTTDQNGNFTMHGIGRERVVELLVSGQNIETKILHARTCLGDPISLPQQFGWKESPVLTYFARGFTHVAASSIPIVGQIVDADTGSPLQGIRLTAGRQVTFSSSGKPYIATVTDAQGRYRLEGLSHNGGDTMYVLPPSGAKYLPLGIRPKITQSRDPITLDFKLKPAQLLRGSVIDRSTGNAIKGSIKYCAAITNPHLEQHDRFRFAGEHESRTNADGEFEIAVIPGKGYITFMADDHERFRRAGEFESSSDSRKVRPSPAGPDLIAAVPSGILATNVHFVQTLDVNDALLDKGVEIKLASGKHATLKIADAKGQPVTTAIIKGMIQPGGWYPTYSDSASVQGYYAEAGRELLVYDPVSNAGAYMKLEGEIGQKTISVKLAPTCTIRGRLVDKSGAPQSKVGFIGETLPQDSSGDVSLRTVTDEDGRFELRGLVLGVKHTIMATQDNFAFTPEITKDLEFESTQTKELGDVVLTR